jgi:lipid-binding SYLF domain-containing protein
MKFIYLFSVFAVNMVLATSLVSADTKDEEERLGNCSRVLKDILNIPDGIPQGLMDKAECFIAIPSVKKFAFGFGGSYGKGAMGVTTSRDPGAHLRCTVLREPASAFSWVVQPQTSFCWS